VEQRFSKQIKCGIMGESLCYAMVRPVSEKRSGVKAGCSSDALHFGRLDAGYTHCQIIMVLKMPMRYS